MGLRVYSDDEVRAKLKQDLPGWTLDGNWIRRRYQTDGWQTSLQLAMTIGFLAEAANHHPDLLVTWGAVDVKIQTHTERAITDKDLEFAREVEAVVLWRPSSDGPFRGGTRRGWVRGGDSVAR
jgi:4a-hydroxytetrahydrobiopterin dehydratase